MSTLKHRTTPASSYFVTTKCAQGRTIFQIPENAQILIDALYRYREKGAYLLHDFVLMPDHLHLLINDWTIRDASDWSSKAEYIGMNPVRAVLVENFRDWLYSSASGKFILDPMPDKYFSETSGAKAPNLAAPTQGLKPLPPKESPAARVPQARGKAGA